jgi:hypothetical protein
VAGVLGGDDGVDDAEVRPRQQRVALVARQRLPVRVVGLSMNTVIAALHDRHVQQQLEVIGRVLERPPALSLKGLTREVTRAALGYLTTPLAA